jgi:HEAT repeat protein
MKRINLPIVALLLAATTLLAGGATAEKPATLASRVDALLARYPAPGAAQRDALAEELLALGKEGLLETFGRLSVPGKADDTSVRYAVDGVTIYANRPGAPEQERLICARALLEALDRQTDPELKAFLIERIRVAGRAEAVKPLAKYLANPRLAGPAARTLGTLRTPEAESALINSLKNAASGDRIAVIDALAGFRSRKAADGVRPFAESPDPSLRTAALRASANIGDPGSEKLLAAMPVASSPGERSEAASRYLLFARRLSESGHKADALRIARAFLEKSVPPDESPARCAALTLLVDIQGKDALDALMDAVSSPEAAFRNHALTLAETIPGPDVLARSISRIAESSPEAQADIIAMLGRRGDQAALPAVMGALKSPERDVRLAAVPAAARLGGNKILADLMPLLRTADEAEAEAIGRTLSSGPMDIAISLAVEAVPGASAPGKQAMIRLLSAKEARDAADLVLVEARSDDPDIRASALKALERLARGSDVAALLALLRASPSPAEVFALQNALAAAANRIPEPEDRASLILAALAGAAGDARVDLIRPLAKIGGAGALRAVIAETKVQDPKLKTVAIHTLASWPDMSAADELFSIVKASDDRKYAYLALEGYVRLIDTSDMSPEKKLAGLVEALAAARNSEEKGIVVTGLAGIRTVEAFRTAAGFLTDPALCAKAAESAARIAMPARGDAGMPGTATARFLKKAAPFLEDDWFRRQVERRAAEILAAEGFIPLFNGEDLLGWRGLVEDPVKRAKMTPAALVAAGRKADEDARAHWKAVDGVLTFDGLGESLCTAKDYRNFELFVDWKIQPSGDSGIYLRGSPQVQIWDPAKAPEGSGGLYNNKIGPAKPLAPADNPVGSWNTFHIVMRGERVTVFLNDTLVVDDVILENYWERDKPIYPIGAIELQAHTTPLEFRDIFVKELAE